MTTETSTTHQPVFPEIQAATNMPFFDGSTLIFCRSETVMEKTVKTKGAIWDAINRNAEMAEKFKNLPQTQQMKYRAWKLAYCNFEDKVIHSIPVGFSDDITERSPTFYREGNRVHLSFVAGTSTIEGPSYKRQKPRRAPAEVRQKLQVRVQVQLSSAVGRYLEWSGFLAGF